MAGYAYFFSKSLIITANKRAVLAKRTAFINLKPTTTPRLPINLPQAALTNKNKPTANKILHNIFIVAPPDSL